MRDKQQRGEGKGSRRPRWPFETIIATTTEHQRPRAIGTELPATEPMGTNTKDTEI